MTFVDEIAEAKSEAEWISWKDQVIDSVDIAAFVARCRNGGDAERIVHYYRGSFNICIHIKFKDAGPDAIIRLTKAGVTAFRDEQVEKLVRAWGLIRQNTTLPLPRLISWGRTPERPRQLGPFIIMDYVDGTHLSDVLKKPTHSKQDKEVLNPDIDGTTLGIVYRQLADSMLQLYELNFTQIGAVSEDLCGSNTWSVTERPLTYNMNELATCTGYPIHQFPTGPFASANKYFRALANQHLIHLKTQRNLATDPECHRQKWSVLCICGI
jgi:hypothetical protein